MKASRFKKRLIATIVAILLLAVASGCGGATPPEAGTTSLLERGKTYQFQMAAVAFYPFSGQVQEIRGDGWVLVKMESPLKGFGNPMWINLYNVAYISQAE